MSQNQVRWDAEPYGGPFRFLISIRSQAERCLCGFRLPSCYLIYEVLVFLLVNSGSDTSPGMCVCATNKQTIKQTYFLYISLDVLRGRNMISRQTLLQLQMIRLKFGWTFLRTRRKQRDMHVIAQGLWILDSDWPEVLNLSVVLAVKRITSSAPTQVLICYGFYSDNSHRFR